MTRYEAVRASKNGAYAAFISGTLTLLFVLYAISSNSQGTISIWNDPANFFDVALIFACGYGMLRKSRFAAVFMFIYFIFAKIAIGFEAGFSGGVVIALIFLYYFGRAVQGTFAFHKIEKAENPNYKGVSKTKIALGTSLVAILLMLITYGLMTMTDMLPSTAVLEKDKISENTIMKLRLAGIIEEGDQVEFFYSDGISEITESGSILTNTKVIMYITDENGEILIYELFFPEITSVTLEQDGNYFNDSIYRVSTSDEDRWLRLFLSTEKRGDVKFVEALRKSIR